MFGLLRTTPLEFIAMRAEEDDVHSFAFRPVRPVNARAGQHGLLTLPGAGTKAFSLASAPADPEVLIGTRLHSGSTYKLALAALRPGQRCTLRGPILNFTADEGLEHAVFLAQGVGITPFRSVLRDLSSTGAPTQTTLIHVGHGHAYRSDTEPLASSAHYPTDTDTFADCLGDVIRSRPGATYYISGAQRFVSATTATLTGHGIRRIKKDRFIGYTAGHAQATVTR